MMMIGWKGQLNKNECVCANLGMFLESKSNTGINTEKMTYEKFNEDWSCVKFRPPLCNHAMLLPRTWLLTES